MRTTTHYNCLSLPKTVNLELRRWRCCYLLPAVACAQVVILNVYCGPKVYPSSRFSVKRRAVLEDAAEVFTHRHLKELFAGSDHVPHLMVIYPEEHITIAAADLVGHVLGIATGGDC